MLSSDNFTTHLWQCRVHVIMLEIRETKFVQQMTFQKGQSGKM